MMGSVLDFKNLDAKTRLLWEVDNSQEPWTVRTEQALTESDLFVARLSHRDLVGHVTIEASGHRKAGGYEYTVTVFDSAELIVRGPSSFSFPQHAVYWARVWLGG